MASADPPAAAGVSDYTAHLNDARPLTLLTRPSSAAAKTFTEALTSTVEAFGAAGGKTYRRGDNRRERLATAVSALVGGLLLNASRHDIPGLREWSWQVVATAAFTDMDVTFRHFATVRRALRSLGYVEEAHAMVRDHGFAKERKATRFRASESLMSLAKEHGLLLPAMAQHFHRKQPPKNPAPLLLRSLAGQFRGKRVRGNDLPLPASAETERLAAEVAAMNLYWRDVEVEGCDPPVFYRVFTHDMNHGGRWYVGDGGYLGMRREDRQAMIRIAGEPVAEVDVAASHLTILHGLKGLPMPDGDPYAVSDAIPRDVVKEWIAQTIGAGRAQARWSSRGQEKRRGGELNQTPFRAADVRLAVLSHYPWLEDLAAFMGCSQEPRLTSLRLQRLEAEALTAALVSLRLAGVPALPIHDGLLVTQGCSKQAWEALKCAYHMLFNVRAEITEK